MTPWMPPRPRSSRKPRRIRPRPERAGESDPLADADAAEFLNLLLTALDTPEVRAKIREVFPAAQLPRPAPARGGGARRGQ